MKEFIQKYEFLSPLLLIIIGIRYYYWLILPGTYTDSIILILIWGVAIANLYVRFEKRFLQIMLIYAKIGLIYFFGIFLTIVILANWEYYFLALILIVSGTILFLARSSWNNFREMFTIVITLPLVAMAVHSIIYISPIWEKLFWYKSNEPVYHACQNSLCVDVYQMGTGFFFGNNYMLITKETGFLGINREIGTVPVGREYCKNIYLTQEENKTVLIFEGNKDYSARMVIQ